MSARTTNSSLLAALGSSLSVVLGVIGALSGCAQVAFNPSYPDNRPAVLRQMAGKLTVRQPGPRNATGKPLALIVTNKPTRIVAYDLQARKTLWTVPADVTSRVIVGRNFVFHRAGERELVGRRISDGTIAWRQPFGEPGERLLGLTAEGDKLYLVTEVVKRSGGGTAGRLVALDGASGSQRWQRPSSGRVGSPTARDGFVFVPLRAQSVAVIDAADGREVARVRAKDEALTWIRSGRQAVFFGGISGIYRFDDRAASGTRKGSTFLSADLPASVRPVYWWNGYNAALSGYTAYDRNRLLWGADVGGDRLRFDRGMIFVHNYRFLFAFGRDDKGTVSAGPATQGAPRSSAAPGRAAAQPAGPMRLRWAYSYPRYDAVASTYTGGAVLLVTAHGHVVYLDPEKGLPVAEEDLKLEGVRGATFDADGFAAPGEGVGQGAPDLRKTLKEVIWDPDRRFGAVKLFAVEQLSQLEGKHIAEDLVAIVTREGIDRAVYQRAGEMIVGRRDKSAIPLYLRTLKPHYSFVDGTRALAVDVMAAALGDLKAPEAVQSLLSHLADHDTPLPAVVAIVKALVAIGDKSVVEPFRDLLLTYRCDPLFAQKQAQNVLNLVADALLKMGGDEERQLLSFIANDTQSLPALRTYVDKLLREAKQPQPQPAATTSQTKPAPVKAAAKR